MSASERRRSLGGAGGPSCLRSSMTAISPPGSGKRRAPRMKAVRSLVSCSVGRIEHALALAGAAVPAVVARPFRHALRSEARRDGEVDTLCDERVALTLADDAYLLANLQGGEGVD